MVRAALTLLLLLGWMSPASASPELIRVELLELRPTQFTVGMHYVKDKRDDLRKLNRKKRDRYLREHPIPAIRGYDGELYMIDHHHLGRAAIEANIDHAYVEVLQDWSELHLTRDEFWDKMKESGFVYLRDEHNRLRSVHSLADQLTDLADDPYRALAGEVRDEGGFSKTNVPFTEFTWANYFRVTIPRTMLETQWKKSVKLAIELSRSPHAQTLPGYRGKMCMELFR